MAKRLRVPQLRRPRRAPRSLATPAEAEEPRSEHRQPLRARARELPSGVRVVFVPPFASGERLDAFLVQHGGEERTRSEWQRLIEAEAVLLNTRPSKPGVRISAGDAVQVYPPPGHASLEGDQDVPFRVVYADAAMVVLDKPAGVVVHPAPGNETGTLVHGLLGRFPELRDVTGDLRPGIVHRLDKDTSGLMVVGRTAAATAELQQQMQARTTEKRYLLLVHGNVSEDEGLIDAPIGRDPKNRQRMAVRAGGREAQTRFYVLERFGDYTFVEALLLTGRTHQLRVHFASIGHPVAGDAVYGAGRAPHGLQRQFVHAYFLKVASPADGVAREFTAEPHPDLLAVLEALRRRGSR